MMENIKEIPYGIANFVEVAEQNMYYVDKTMYLPLLEKQPRNKENFRWCILISRAPVAEAVHWKKISITIAAW